MIPEGNPWRLTMLCLFNAVRFVTKRFGRWHGWRIRKSYLKALEHQLI